MIDGIRSKVGNFKFPTWYRGQEQIDSIWISKDLKVKRAKFLTFFFRIGDHRRIMTDVPRGMILGTKITKYINHTQEDLCAKKGGSKEIYWRTWKANEIPPINLKNAIYKRW